MIIDCRLYTLHNSFCQTETVVNANATVTDGVRDTVDHKNACLCLGLYSLITDCKLYTHNSFHQTETLAHMQLLLMVLQRWLTTRMPVFVWDCRVPYNTAQINFMGLSVRPFT